MSFGFKNVAQAFQRLMESIFCDINFVFVYLDDFLIASAPIISMKLTSVNSSPSL